jgi:ectoine hydroxylase-related dioxygenase (phytanoyl-CoA dioxygenase family)
MSAPSPLAPAASTELGAQAAALAAQAAAFRRDGCLVLRQVFQGAELADLRRRAQAVKDRAMAAGVDGMRFWYRGSVKAGELPAGAERMPYSWGVNEITRPALCDPVLISTLGHPRLDPVLSTILDRPRAWGLKMLWAPLASAYDLHWHRDIDGHLDPVVAYKPDANDHLQFNAALEPDDSFIVVPGSHRRPLRDDERALIAASRTAELPGQIRVKLDPGDIVLMDAHAIHRGQAAPGAPRLSLHYSCQAQWVPLCAWGESEHERWITSDAFMEQLSPATRPYYQRLVTAERAPTQHDWMVEHARQQGWTGELTSPWPGAGKKKSRQYSA